MGVVGTAPGAKIWALKVIPDTPNSGDDSNILEGLYYVAAHSDEIEVANLSFGHFGYNGAVEAAVNALVIRGVVFVAAAGNENTDISANYNTPGSIPVAITVSAITDSDGKCGGVGRATVQPGSQVKHQGIGITNPDDFFASYSNYGSVVDLFAPGSNILTIDTTGGYSNQSGTSLSAPIVAGAAALTKSLHQAARPEGIDRYLKEIGTQWTGGNPLDPCNGAGQGYFNARYPVPLDRVIHTSWIYNDIRRVSTQPLLYIGNIT
jgi:subtilisin family serine protease